MRLGVCCGPGSVEASTLGERALKMQDILQQTGAEYFEMVVGSVMADNYRELKEALSALEMKPEAFNSFIPGTFRLTGEEIDHDGALEYAKTALERCAEIGGHVVVLGSAGARKMPEGFDKKRAMSQFRDFCVRLGPVAQDANITIALEPLNAREDNLLLSVEDGIRLVDDVAHPSIQLLADLYHMNLEGESVESVASAGVRLVHTHLASASRLPPGSEEGDTVPYADFFAACRKAGYDGRCSFEGQIVDLASDSRTLIATLKRYLEA